MFSFSIKNQCGAARLGILSTAHGDIQTPAFMPVGTAGTVKGMTPEAVAQTGAEILLGNTYHLMLRPGAQRVAALGGLHKMMNWNKPILTDSGGFQVMSLSKLRKITEKSVTFQSHVDGSSYELTPERAMEIQHLLGSDITMVLDECTPYPATYAQARDSMQLSMRWAQRCRHAFDALKKPSTFERGLGEGNLFAAPLTPALSHREREYSGYGLFGIVQGSTFKELREESANTLVDIGFDGYAIGGLAVGEGQKVMFDVLNYAPDMLPKDKPRYLMGVGKPSDIIGAVQRGVDMFDCVIPTRSGRFGRAYTSYGEINIMNARFTDDATPLDSLCNCYACSHYSRAYIQHLIKADEMLGATLMSWHNLAFYQTLMKGLRGAIKAGALQQFADGFLQLYAAKE